MRENARRFWILASAAAFVMSGPTGCRGRAPSAGNDSKIAAPAAQAGNTPANAPAGKAGAAGDAAKGKAPAQAAGQKPSAKGAAGATAASAGAGGTAAAAGGKVETPFPGKAGAAPVVRIAQARSLDAIPGVPRLALPLAGRSPFRGKGLFGAAGGRAKPGKIIRPPTRVVRMPPMGIGPGTLPALGDPLGPGGLFPMGTSAGPATRDIPPPAAATGANAGAAGGAAAGAAGGVEPAPPPPSLQLTGVIQGIPLMAIIEGEKQHYIVQEGDVVAGGYRVSSISLHRVILNAFGDRMLVLRFGKKG